MGLPGMPPNRARSCRRHFLVLMPEHLADRLPLGGSRCTRVDRTMRSPTTISNRRHDVHTWFPRSNRGPIGCPTRGQMDPEIASRRGIVTHRRHQRESHVCICLNRIPT
jgi:hypothetical protein